MGWYLVGGGGGLWLDGAQSAVTLVDLFFNRYSTADIKLIIFFICVIYSFVFLSLLPFQA